MKAKRVILTGIIVGIIYMCLETLVHGYLLKDLYMQTASIWRPESEMANLFWMIMLANMFFAFMFVVIFAAGFDSRKSGIKQGIFFGILMALLLAPMTGLVWYVILPIPVALAFYWFIAGAAQMLLLGIITGLIYRP